MMTRITILSFALASLVGAVGCQKTATTVPEEPAAKDWEPPEGEQLEAEGRYEEERAPFLSARNE